MNSEQLFLPIGVTTARKKQLIAERRTAYYALHIALQALREMRPDARDYPEGTLRDAQFVHEVRINSVEYVMHEIMTEAIAIQR